MNLKQFFMPLGSALTTAILAITPVGATEDFQVDVFTRSFTVDAVGLLPDPPVLADIPDFGVVRLLRCGQSPPPNSTNQIGVQLLSSADAEPFLGVSQVIASALPLGTGKGEFIDLDARIFEPLLGPPLIAVQPVFNASTGMAAKWDFQLSRGTGTDVAGAHVRVSGFFDQNMLQCHVTAMTVLRVFE